MSKNAEGWIRHRGSKCPVEKGTRVDVRYRDGDIHIDVPAQTIECHSDNWLHTYDKNSFDARCDIMAYRLHKTAERVEACSKPELQIKLPENYGEILDRSEGGPLQWRDRIAEIDATTHALTTERADLVQKLASEGFALIGRIVEPVEDMSDWRNWKEGDLLEMVKASDWDAMVNGGLYEMKTPKVGHNFAVINDNGNLKSFSLDRVNNVTTDFKWHSRPSA